MVNLVISLPARKRSRWTIFEKLALSVQPKQNSSNPRQTGIPGMPGEGWRIGSSGDRKTHSRGRVCHTGIAQTYAKVGWGGIPREGGRRNRKNQSFGRAFGLTWDDRM